jgi:hypothetical protein
MRFDERQLCSAEWQGLRKLVFWRSPVSDYERGSEVNGAFNADSSWCFTAVGLNGRTRSVSVDRLRGTVRLLTPADSVWRDTGLPHAFVWNPDQHTFEPVIVRDGGDVDEDGCVTEV